MGLHKYYLEVDLCRMLRGRNPKSSLCPEPGLRDLGDSHPGCVPLIAGHLFLSPGCQTLSQMCVLHLRVFTSLSLILGKQEWEGKQPIFLPHVRLPPGTRSSPFHNPALPEPFPAHIKLFFLSAPSPHTQHIPFMCSAPWPYLSLSP